MLCCPRILFDREIGKTDYLPRDKQAEKKTQETMKNKEELTALVIIAASIITSLCSWACGFSSSNILWRMFYHANIFHLALNVFAAWTTRNIRLSNVIAETVLAVAFGALGLWLSPSFSVGLSALLFARIGFVLPRCPFERNVPYYAVLAVTLLAGTILPSIAFVSHIVPLSAAWVAGWISLKARRLYGK